MDVASAAEASETSYANQMGKEAMFRALRQLSKVATKGAWEQGFDHCSTALSC